jgi:hypothetical protein
MMIGRPALLLRVPNERWEVNHPDDLEVLCPQSERLGWLGRAPLLDIAMVAIKR